MGEELRKENDRSLLEETIFQSEAKFGGSNPDSYIVMYGGYYTRDMQLSCEGYYVVIIQGMLCGYHTGILWLSYKKCYVLIIQ